MKRQLDKLSFLLFVVSCALLIFGYGIAVGKYHIFPYKILPAAVKGYQQWFDHESYWYVKEARNPNAEPLRVTGKASRGVTLITRIGKDLKLIAEVIDIDGRVLHRWNINWFALCPNHNYLPAHYDPESLPGTHIHGAVLLEGGDLVFNFDGLGLIRLNPEGNVVWHLPYQTHHSIQLDEEGNLWVCGLKERPKNEGPSCFRKMPYDVYSILVISPEGKILHDWRVEDILKENNREDLLPLGAAYSVGQDVRGDLLHLNDVEPFPLTMKEDFFNKQDVMVSLRNVNTVFVFNRKTMHIKYITTGMFDEQHDPDFIDGDHFSVFDNNPNAGFSRIVIVSARENTMEVYYKGTKKKPFFSAFMGKEQWLPNGNLLVTESLEGRAFEIDKDKEIVWEYMNLVGDGKIGLLEEAHRYPMRYGNFYKRKHLAENTNKT